MERPQWFAVTLLVMLAILMIAHLGVLYVGVWECDEYARVLLQQARRLAETKDEMVRIEAANTECNNVEQDFSALAAQYIAVILALLGGAATVKQGSTK